MPEQKPLFSKCCFCLPLRASIILWNYLRLINALAGAFTLSFVVLPNERVPLFVIFLIVCLLFDAAMITSHIVGAHKNNVKLLKFSVYYNILWCIVILGIVGYLSYETYTYCRYCHGVMFRFIKFFIPGFAAACVQSYVILLTRSEIVVIKNKAVKDQLWKNAYERAQCAGAVKQDPAEAEAEA